MSNMEINQVLAQMRALNSELRAAGKEEAVTQTNFSDVLANAIDKVSEQQNAARTMVNEFEAGTGDASLAEVMVSMQKASISFRAMTEVRNKLIDAYQEVMNMPI